MTKTIEAAEMAGGGTVDTVAPHPIPQEAFDWYDEYAHGLIDRRTFLSRLAGLSAAGYSMALLTSALLPNYAEAEQVSFNDPDIKATYETFASPKGNQQGKGYLVVPVRSAENKSHKKSAVLVVHENRGLNPYIKDVARRVAKAGYIAFAPDGLYPAGGYPGNDDDGRALQAGMDREKLEQDFIAAAYHIKNHALANGKLGAVGFCFGGYIVNMLAATMGKDLDAGVPFYGTPAAASIRKNIKAPLLVQLAELDTRVNATWPEYEQALKANQVQYKMVMYPKTQHGFHNDSTARFDPANAELAWQKTLNFFDTYLKSDSE
ncbi:Carboxymethylenebutenolidase [Thalassocella blandensis]|nr:Carboxymethylenebutenolidase [Thalassocella blandensis]